jgi:PHD-finger
VKAEDRSGLISCSHVKSVNTEHGNDTNSKDLSNITKVETSKAASSAAAQAATAASKNDNDDDDESEEGSIEVGACCLCHCSLDYSDRAAFFRADREEDYNDDADEDDYFYRRTDPYLPAELYDKSNALVYCDGCDRLYHQKCHFVPVLSLPRGKWHCLVCQSLNNKNKALLTPSRAKSTTTTTVATSSSKNKKKKNNKASGKNDKKTNKKASRNNRKAPPAAPKAVVVTSPITPLSKQEWRKRADELFVSPPPSPPGDVEEVRALKCAWESDTRLLKATAWKTELQQRLRQFTATQATNYRLAYTTILTLTSTSKNRKSFSSRANNKTTTTMASQELAQTLVRLTSMSSCGSFSSR